MPIANQALRQGSAGAEPAPSHHATITANANKPVASTSQVQPGFTGMSRSTAGSVRTRTDRCNGAVGRFRLA